MFPGSMIRAVSAVGAYIDTGQSNFSVTGGDKPRICSAKNRAERFDCSPAVWDYAECTTVIAALLNLHEGARAGLRSADKMPAISLPA